MRLILQPSSVRLCISLLIEDEPDPRATDAISGCSRTQRIATTAANSPSVILASLRPFRNAATFDALKARTPRVRRWMDCRAPHPQGGALLLRPSSALILFEAGILGLAGVRRPGRSMGPPHLHRMSERHIVVANLGYTPRSPVPRFRTPPASPAWRGSLVADSRSGF